MPGSEIINIGQQPWRTAVNALPTWHKGEIEAQSRVGTAEHMAEIGPKVIRDFMPDQHRLFMQQLPFIVVGSLDAQQRPWASILAGLPGFMSSPHPRRLEIEANPLPGDP